MRCRVTACVEQTRGQLRLDRDKPLKDQGLGEAKGKVRRGAERLDSAHLSGNQHSSIVVKNARFGPRGGTLLLEALARGMGPRRRGSLEGM